jgi:hypothetical protein
MKFSASLLSLVLALSATATPTPVKRDAASIESAIASIASAVNALDTTEKAYTGGATTALQTASDAVVSATNAGTTTANASGDLSDLDALSLVTPIQDLTTDVQTAVTDIINLYDLISAAGAVSQTLNDLIAQNTSATALANAITAKVPADLQSTAAGLSAGITDAIQKGITAYSS